MIDAQESDKLTGTNNWTQLSLSAIAPSGTDMVKAILMLWNDSGVGNEGNAYFDDVSLNISR